MEASDGLVLGTIFVYAGAFISPVKRKETAGVMAGLVFIFSGMSLNAAIYPSNSVNYLTWQYAVSIVTMLVASGSTAFLIITDKIDPSQNPFK